MDLIDRYLAAVRRYLPTPQQDDIVSELSDSLRSELEEQEQSLNRRLTESEQAALLKQRGHPWLLASRYLPQQYLVGPALFPYYRQALQLVVFWVVLPIILIGGALNTIYAGAEVTSFVGELVRAVAAGWNGAIYAVGIVTIVFYVLDHEKVKINVLDNWDPAALPEPSHARYVSRSETVIGLVFTLTFIVWWIGLIRVPGYLMQPHENLQLTLAPVWTAFYLPILITAIAAAVIHLIDLVRPWRSATVSMAEIVVNVSTTIILALVLKTGEYVVVTGAGVYEGNIDRAYWLNTLVGWGLTITMLFIAAMSLIQMWRLFRPRRTLAVA